MNRWRSIMKATALEMISEPLSLLVLLSSLVMAVLAPAFHYHQFGEATRMARDAGFSALFLGGSVIAVFGTIRAFRREIESGTLEMALANPVSRGGFFLAKTCGAIFACLVFALTVFAVSVTTVNGAAIGGAVAAKSGDVAKIWGPSLALGVAAIVLPLVTGAALNRFLRARFVFSAALTALAVALAGTAYRFNGAAVLRLAPVAVLLTLPAAVLLAAAAAFSMRFRANAAASACALVFAAMVPFVGNYYLSDALSRGGTLPWAYVALAAAAALPAFAAFLVLGVHFADRVDA